MRILIIILNLFLIIYLEIILLLHRNIKKKIKNLHLIYKSKALHKGVLLTG